MNRHEATRRVMMTLSQPGSETKIPFVAPDGSRPIVVCTPGEYLSEVTKRVDAVGGAANLVLAEVKQFQSMTIETVQYEGAEADAEDVNADISMGMFWIRARGRRGKQSLFHIAGVDVSTPQAFSYA
jgi:hypothetical protein